jgi:hypothetical protein
MVRWRSSSMVMFQHHPSLQLWFLTISWSTRNMSPCILRWALRAWWASLLPSWGNITFEEPAHGVLVVVLVIVMMMYTLGVGRFDENWCQVCIFCQTVCTNPSVDKLVLCREHLFVNSWCNTVIHFYNYVSLVDYVLYISRHLNCYCIEHLVDSVYLLGNLTT